MSIRDDLPKNGIFIFGHCLNSPTIMIVMGKDEKNNQKDYGFSVKINLFQGLLLGEKG